MNAYISNRKKNRPKFPEDREKFGTEFMDDLEKSAFGRFFDLSGERQRIIDQASREGKLGKVSQFIQKAEDKVGEVVAPVLKPVGAALGKISDVTQIDERISTPLTFVAAGAAAKGISKIKPKHLGITQTIEPYTPPKGLGKVPRKMVNITDQVDDVFKMPSIKVQDIVRVAKKNKISYKKAQQYVELRDLGIIPTQSINPGTNEGTKKQILVDPLDDMLDITYASTDDIRNAELALKAKGVAAPTTEDLYNYLSEYKTDLTIQPQKEWYNKNFKKTTIHDLALYSKSPKDFTAYNTFEEAFTAAEANLLTTKLGTKKRWQGIDAKIGDEYVKFFGTKNEGIKVLPYNKWHQIKKNPFVVPKDVINKLKKSEPRQIDLVDDKPPTIEKITKKGNIIEQTAQTKFDEGTVDQFVKYVNDEIAWQTEQQRLDEDFAKALYKDLGIRYRRGKTVFSRDKSHAVPRSEGGPGYTFLEAWWSNQQRGAKEILKPEILADLGIPKTWEEYFYRWYQQQGLGEPVTDLGKLADISWDDYERAMNGVPVNQIKIDRKTINHLIQRQIEDPYTINQPGNIGATIGEDFEILVKRTKGLDPDDELLGEINPKEFDLKWRADTFKMGQEAKGEFLKEKYVRRVYQKAYRQNVKEQKKTQKKASRETKQLEKKGQGKLFEFLNNLFPDR